MCVASTLLDTREAISPPRPQSPRAFYLANFMTARRQWRIWDKSGLFGGPGINEARRRALAGLPHICHAETR